MANRKGKYSAPIPAWQGKKVLLLVALLLLLSVAAVVAYFVHTSQTEENSFEKVDVSCLVQETLLNNVKSQIMVENTSTVPAYVRVRLVTYWLTPSGSVAGRTSEMPSFDLAEGWIADTENNTYYYTLPVDAGHVSPNMLRSSIHLATPTQSEGYVQVVEVLAEAIQAQPDDAAVEAWDLVITDGKITAIG